MKKKTGRILFLLFMLTHLSVASASSTFVDEFSPVEKQVRLKEIEKSLSSLKHWQGQYKRKQKNYQTRATRMQFRNSTESRQYKEMAQEAKENVLVLQDQIDSLLSQKQYLLSKN